MLYKHVFDKISTKFCGIFCVFVNFAVFRGFTWISRLRDRAKYQKPCSLLVVLVLFPRTLLAIHEVLTTFATTLDMMFILHHHGACWSRITQDCLVCKQKNNQDYLTCLVSSNWEEFPHYQYNNKKTILLISTQGNLGCLLNTTNCKYFSGQQYYIIQLYGDWYTECWI